MRWSRTTWVVSCCSLLSAPLVLGADPDSTRTDERTLRAAHVGTNGSSLLAFLRGRTLTAEDRRQIAALVQQLGDVSYKVRHRASVRLVARGCLAAPALRLALEDTDLEVAHRAKRALHLIQDRDAGPDVTAAATRLVALKRPRGSSAVLLAFLPFADNDSVTEEVLGALGAVAVRSGKPDSTLIAALAARDPIKRAAAAEALCRAGLFRKRPALRRLLRDPEPMVRLQVALALTRAGQKDAVPVLIDLLTQLPPNQAYRAQDCLYRLGEDRSPALPLGVDAEGRRKCRDAWAAWWRKHGARTDLARLRAPSRLLGYTLLVLLDAGKVLERDADGKQRWVIDGLELPVDVDVLPGGRVLITEHAAGRVTERNRKGDILWEKKIAQPLMAQRLANGNTFIATRSELVEINRAGKEVASYSPPAGDLMMRGRKLPNGDVACVTMDQMGESKYLRLSAAGKQLARFPVAVSTYGGRIEVLPNGRVLVPEMGSNRVVEYDATGRVAWQVTVEQPVAAVRLPNGNTLITMYNQQRAIELDRGGKEAAEYRADTRVTRAWRR